MFEYIGGGALAFLAFFGGLVWVINRGLFLPLLVGLVTIFLVAGAGASTLVAVAVGILAGVGTAGAINGAG